MHVTETVQLIIRKSKHVKTTQITAKQYFKDLLDKHRKIDPVEDILKLFENQTLQNKTFTNSEQLNNVPIRNSTCDTQQDTTQTIPEVTIAKERYK